MTALETLAGLPIAWNRAGDDLIFDHRIQVKEIKSRLRGQLRPVLPDDRSCAPAGAVQYWMYNGISLPQHIHKFAELGIQYELTLLYPHRLGREHSKTLGHIHTFVPESRLNHAEVIEVVAGEALFLMQTLDVERKTASWCRAIHARAGDKVVFPPNTHHLTINAGEGMLLFADLISVRTRGSYDGLSAMQGAAYLYADHQWMLNPTYQAAASLEIREADEFPEMGLSRSTPLYELIGSSPDLLAWLDKPESFGDYFPGLWAQVATHLVP